MTKVFETVKTKTPKVACDGGKGALGHPKVYLDMGKEDNIKCPYCSRVFTLKKT